MKHVPQQLATYLLLWKVSSFFIFTSKIIIVDLDGQSKGFGFITFEKLEDAQKAIQTMNGKKILGKYNNSTD